MVNIYDVSLLDLLPPNVKTDPDIIAAANSIDSECLLITNEINNCVILPDIDNLQDNVLDILAWQLHVDYYDNVLDIHKKRELVKNSIVWHKTKGTPSAVEELVSTAFDESKVQEWFEYEGDTFKFRIITTDRIIDNEKLKKLLKAVDSVKNKRSHLEGVFIERENRINHYFGGFVHIGKKHTIHTQGV